MFSSNLNFTRSFFAGTLLLALGANTTFGANAYPVFTDLNASGGLVFGATDIFDDTGMMEWDETAVYQGNDILVATLLGTSDNAGIGFTVAISNGENGITSTDLGENIDIDNTEPVNAAIAAANGGGKLSNGNIIRGSVWMRSDPNSPATGVGSPGAASMPQVEGLLKVELWKEALSDFADYEGPGDSDYGDRIWDQDQQGNAGSFADINADGFSGGFGAAATMTLNTETWTQMVVEYVVDDSPSNAGNTTFPWDIGVESFTVADVEDIRVVFYAGDFGSTDFTDGGSWWMDNLLVEVFADQAAADAVDPTSTNPAPVEGGIRSDFDEDGDVDGADFLGLQRTNPAGIADWENDYGNGVAPLTSLSNVPEPTSMALLFLGIACLNGTVRRNR